MVSEFRKKKLLHVFYAFLDTEKSGRIDKKTFEVAMLKIAKIRGYNPGEITYELMKELLLAVWEGLVTAADDDGNGEVSAEEWIKMWDEYAKKPEQAPEWQALFSRCIFQIEDASSDEAIDCDEFAAVYESLGLDKQKSIDAFKKMAQGKDKVTWPEFQELWKEYFTTENPEDPGNFIFGC